MRAAAILLMFYLFCPARIISQMNLPALFITPYQLVRSGNALEGMRIKMEVVYSYRASIQKDSLYQKCTVEGKFRETHRKEDEVVLFAIYIPNSHFIHHFTELIEGTHLTITGRVVRADGPWSKVVVDEISVGWESDRIKEMEDSVKTAHIIKSDTVDAADRHVLDTLMKRIDTTAVSTKKDTFIRKIKEDTSWVK